MGSAFGSSVNGSQGDGSSVPGAQRSIVGDIPVPKDQPGLQQVCPHSLIGKTMEPSPWRETGDRVADDGMRAFLVSLVA